MKLPTKNIQNYIIFTNFNTKKLNFISFCIFYHINVDLYTN